jgi:hypothetical protein
MLFYTILELLKFIKGKEDKIMKRNWSKFSPKVAIIVNKEQDRLNLGRPCCGGSCIGGNCKATKNVSKIFS